MMANITAISRLPLRSAVSTHSCAADNTGSGGSAGDRGGKRRALGRPRYCERSGGEAKIAACSPRCDTRIARRSAWSPHRNFRSPPVLLDTLLQHDSSAAASRSMNSIIARRSCGRRRGPLPKGSALARCKALPPQATNCLPRLSQTPVSFVPIR
jgi:hypothetical protein